MVLDSLSATLSALSIDANQCNLAEVVAQAPHLKAVVRGILSKLAHAKGCLQQRKLAASVGVCQQPDCTAYVRMLQHISMTRCSSPTRDCGFGARDCSCFSASVALAHFLHCPARSTCTLCSDLDDKSTKTNRTSSHAGATSAAPAPITGTDQSTKKHIRSLRNQLKIISHAQICRVCPSCPVAFLFSCFQNATCGIRLCSESRQILDHLNACRLGAGCQAIGCSSFRRLLFHYFNCKSDEVCVGHVDRQQEASKDSMSHSRSGGDMLIAEELLRLNRSRRHDTLHEDESSDFSSSLTSSDHTAEERTLSNIRRRAVSAPMQPSPLQLVAPLRPPFLPSSPLLGSQFIPPPQGGPWLAPPFLPTLSSTPLISTASSSMSSLPPPLFYFPAMSTSPAAKPSFLEKPSMSS